MLKFWKKPLYSSNNYIVALDIGSEFIKAAVCDTKNPSQHEVIGYCKVKQPINSTHSGSIIDIAKAVQQCKTVVETALKSAGVSTQQIVVGTSGELIQGATRTMTFTRDDSQAKIDLSELNNIIHKLQWKAFEQIRYDLSQQSGFNEIDIKLIDAAILDIKIDGYAVNNPLGFQGKEVTVNFFNAFSPLPHYGILQTIVAELNFELLAITALPYCLIRHLQRSDPPLSDGIFIDIGGATTDIVVVTKGRIIMSNMFTVGGRTFTKRLARALNVSFEEAEDIKIAYSKGLLEKQSQAIVKKALVSDAELWLSGVEMTLGTIEQESSGKALPPSISLCGGGSLLPEIKESLESRDWYKSLSFPRKPHVRFLTPKQFPTIADATGTMTSAQDIPPLALAALAGGAESEQSLNKILKKVVRLMHA